MCADFIHYKLAKQTEASKFRTMKKNKATGEAFEKFCSERGIKKTVQRYAVFESVYKTPKHPTVEEIFQDVKETLPLIKLESVYRILTDFKKEGLLNKLTQKSVMRYDGNTEPHGHFVCSECGKIVDIPLRQISLPPSLEGAKDLKYTVNGVCPDCAANKKRN
jgi:transcriptional regulator (furR family)